MTPTGKVRRPHGHSGQRAGNIFAWALLALAFVAPATGLSAAAWMASQQRTALTAESTPLTADVQVSEFDDARDVQLTLSWADGPALIAPAWYGTVTQLGVAPGQEVTSGTQVVRIDDVWRIAARTEQPFFAPVMAQSSAEELARLNGLLRSLGYDSQDNDRWGAGTVRGVRQLAASLGVPNAEAVTAFDPGWVVWLPADRLRLAGADFAVGGPAPSGGSPAFSTARALASIDVAANEGEALPDPEDGSVWSLHVGETTIPFAGSKVTDPNALATVQIALQGSYPETSVGTIARVNSVRGWEVPSSAVFLDSEGKRCLFVDEGDFTPYPVEVAGGGIGVARVTGDMPDRIGVLTNPSEVEEVSRCA
jgi:hypothetical protein